jgi:hypothetical protein
MSENQLTGTRALILVEDPEMSSLLHGHLVAMGIECWEARCLAGASALLRRDEMLGKPADFLFADEELGGLCGMSLCAALLLPLRNRPRVLLATRYARTSECRDMENNCVDAVFDMNTSAAELRVLLHKLQLPFAAGNKSCAVAAKGL